MALFGLDDEDVVISGISTAFPGSRNFADLSKKLSESIPIRPVNKLTIPVGKFLVEILNCFHLISVNNFRLCRRGSRVWTTS